MANSPVDLGKARETLRKAQREIGHARHRLAASSAPISFAAAKARHSLNEAELAVKKMQALLNAGRGGRINFALVRDIRAAECRVTQARLQLRAIDPTSTE
jgi:hypothetical protein